ncbi:MAG: hypothetical protein APF80_01185 [Alphaproteobacteria bacterium BRH_c36]|nr:MAG: hypothetical protein APF80_01185 [Alphaproteobacteria bacterium BRH_c36]
MSGVVTKPQKASSATHEAYFLEFAEMVRGLVTAPLMVTGGFRTAAGMDAVLRSGALDIIGLARLLAIDPEAPAALLRGQDSQQRVRPMKTGITKIDRMGIMEISWYAQQLKRIANGGNPRPHESASFALVRALVSSGWGTFRTRRLRS